MKLVRFGPAGKEQPGCLDAQDQIRDLSEHLNDITAKTLTPDNLAALQALDITKLPIINTPSIRLGTPYTGTGKFIGVGLNYKDHAKEIGSDLPNEPILFTKWCSPTGPYDDVALPPHANKADWEVELGIVIGSTAKHVSEANALDYIAGYCIVNDISERHYQLEKGGTWDKGKGYEGFGPIGPWLVTKDALKDPQNLGLWLTVNDESMQAGHTSDMIFSVPYLIHYISQFTTLYPGDLIATGTPAGVGAGRIPPRFLKSGDVIKLGVEGLGYQTQTII